VTETADGTPDAAAKLNVTALFAEAAGKSGLMWVEVPGDRAWPFWHAWADDTVYAVSGPGEQTLPWLPEQVHLVLRSKDTGGRLITVHATARELRPEDADWDAAVDVVRPERLNAVGDTAERWRQSCTIHVLTPHGRLVEGPGSYTDASGAAPVRPTATATAGWRPWHWRGRAGARRNNRG